MSVLHNSFFEYNAALSQLLEARRQNSANFGLHNSCVGYQNGFNFIPTLGSASGSDTAESLSPSPPVMHGGKSFTIDSILGIRSNGNSNNSNTTALDFSSQSSAKRLNSNELSSDELNNAKGTNIKGKSKRVRTIFTPEQLERLEAEFERQQYMVGPERLYLAHTLQLTEAQVKVWFQNRRIKWRKQHLEMTQQRLALLKQHRQQRLLHQHRQRRISSSEDNDNDNDAGNTTTNTNMMDPNLTFCSR